MSPRAEPSPGNGRGTPLVWLSDDPTLYASLEADLGREGFRPERLPLRRAATVRLRDEDSVAVLEVDDPGRGLALSRRLRGADGRAPSTLLVLRGGGTGLLRAALQGGTLDAVDGPDPAPEQVLTRLALLRRSRAELRELGLLRREMTRRLRQLRMIHHVGKRLAFALDPDELCRTAVEALREVFRYPRAAILLREDPPGDLVLRAQAGHPEGEASIGAHVASGRGLVGAAVRTGEVVSVGDVLEDPRYVRLHGSDARSELVVPIRAEGAVRGVLDLQATAPDAFDAADREALETLADQVGAGLENARLVAELRGRSEEIGEAYRKLRESDRLKDGFLSSVSHELRTPLTSIRSFSEILLAAQDEDPATAREFVGIIHAESLRLTRLVDNLLDISRMNAGMMAWDPVEVAPGPVLRRAVRAAASLGQEKGIDIRLDLDPELPNVRIDEDRVIQVCLNLLGNAIKFSGRGTAVDLRARRDGTRLLVSVEDRGPGIPDHELPHIFEKFRQGGDALRGKPSGSGLGLTICREIVEHHGGAIEVESRPGRGSVFTFSLPVLAPDEDAAGPETGAAPPPAAGADPAAVLVVSNRGDVRHDLLAALADEGVAASEAPDPEEALRRLENDSPGQVLVDLLGLPAGEPDARLIRRSAERDIPLLLAAPLEGSSPLPGARDAALARPVEPDELVRVAWALLGHRPPRVVLLEADPRPRRFMASVLDHAGMEVFPAGSEGELLRLARAERPDLIVVGGAEEAVRTVRSSSLLATLPVLHVLGPELARGEFLRSTSPASLAREVAGRRHAAPPTGDARDDRR